MAPIPFENVRLTVPLTIAEASQRLHVSRDTVRRMIARGELAAYRVGRQWRIESADVAAYIYDHRADAVAGGSIA